MFKKKRKSDLLNSSEVLQSLLRDGKSDLAHQFKRWKIWYKWPEVIGQTIAKHCEPVGFQRGNLYIWVKSSSWMNQLVFLQEDMKKKINEAEGGNWVKRIRFTLDRHSVPKFDEAPDTMKKFLRPDSDN